MEAQLLAGLKVIDAGTWIAAPAAATVMSDFGAEVVKLEALTGDPLRQLASGPGGLPCAHDYFWVLDARNKRSLALDLKAEGARPIVDALVREADVLVTNFRPELAERLGLDWPRLQAINPRLVYGQVTGYGDRGPEADRPGYDTTAWWSRTGLADWVRVPGTRPALSAPGMGDHATAMSLFGAIMTALWARERTGRGRRVSTSLFANGLWSNGMLTSLKLCGAPLPPRDPDAAVANALAVQYETCDGRWLQLTLLNEAREWPKLLIALGAEELRADPRFTTPEQRREHAATLHAELAWRFRDMTLDAARDSLADAGIPAAVLTTLDDLPTDPQARAADILTPVADPRPGWEETVASPIWIEGAAKRAPAYAPAIGEHSHAILAELGFDATAVRRLAEAGIIAAGDSGTTAPPSEDRP
ncbi:MAG: CoA transferase [Pseudomonadales bacterium]|jgi:crotonobetainyl-CoA:carnitine CoA-transferase CaiB-like acyl-CoA transferase|nr:CoA transferase [Pseudomonadales bacterium]